MHRLITAFSLISCATITAVGLIPAARADEWNKKTTITINEPVEVNHKVLTPGKYVFKLVDSQSDRHIVQIFNEKETKLIETILAIPNYRLKPTGKSVFAFWETPAGQPPALRAWFYPGDNFGQEFKNSKPAGTEVASTAAAEDKYPQPTQEVMAAPAKETETVIAQSTPPPEPAPAPVTAEEPAPAPEPAPALEPQPTAPLVAQNEPVLPQTASEYPVVVLAGLFFLSLFAVATLFGAKRTQ